MSDDEENANENEEDEEKAEARPEVLDKRFPKCPYPIIKDLINREIRSSVSVGFRRDFIERRMGSLSLTPTLPPPKSKRKSPPSKSPSSTQSLATHNNQHYSPSFKSSLSRKSSSEKFLWDFNDSCVASRSPSKSSASDRHHISPVEHNKMKQLQESIQKTQLADLGSISREDGCSISIVIYDWHTKRKIVLNL